MHVNPVTTAQLSIDRKCSIFSTVVFIPFTLKPAEKLCSVVGAELYAGPYPSAFVVPFSM